MRARARSAVVAILAGGPFVLAFFSGGYFDRARLIAGLIVWVLVALVALVAPQPVPRSGAGLAALLGLAALCAWSAASISWAPISAAAVDDAQRLLLYLGWFALAIAALRSRRDARVLEPAIALGTTVLVAYALSERLLPTVVELSRSESAAGRLEQPLTYWNAMGILAAIALVLCARLLGDEERRSMIGRLAAAAAPVLGLGLFLTFSRASLASAVVGLVALGVIARTSRQWRALALIAGGAAVAVAASALFPGVRTLEGSASVRADGGAVMLAVLVLVAIAAAVIAPRVVRSTGTSARPRPARRRTLVLAVAVLALAGLAAGSFLERGPEVKGADTSRFGSTDSNRYSYWPVALRTFADHPAAGRGAGGFRVDWLREREVPDPIQDAHSLYLETAAELGLIGLLALAVFVGGVAVCAVRTLRADPVLATGPVVACGMWALHAGLDWDMEMPTVTLPVLALAGALIAAASANAPRAG